MNARENAMRILKLCLGAALLMALVAAGFANAGEEAAGTTAANFLATGSGARTLAMGGATLGLGTDVGSGAWNTAALGWVDKSELVFSHSGLANGSKQEWAALGGRWGSSQTRWMLSGLYHGDGLIEGRDASNQPTASFSPSSFAVGTHLAQQVAGSVTLGLGAKMVRETLGEVSGWGVTFDGGLMYRRGMLGLGVAAQNLGGQMHYPDGSVYRFPGNVGAGVAVAHPGTGLRAAVDMNLPLAYHADVRAGLEWQWKEVVALRAGYRHELSQVEDDLSGPSFGVGAGTNGLWLDYGYLVAASGEGQHRMGVRFFPGHWGGLGGDPFGQGDMPRELRSTSRDSDAPLVGPPVPKDLGSPRKKKS